MTREETIRATMRTLDVPRARAVELLARADSAAAAVDLNELSIGQNGANVSRITMASAYGIHETSQLKLAEHWTAHDTGRRALSTNGVLLHVMREIRGGLSLSLGVAPRTKKNHTSWFGVQAAPYRRYRDVIVEAIGPLRMAYGEPILPDQAYNCRAVFYVDRYGEKADYNGLNQGLHDALENAGVVSDDWFFRTCDGTRIVPCDDTPRVDVFITPLTTGS